MNISHLVSGRVRRLAVAAPVAAVLLSSCQMLWTANNATTLNLMNNDRWVNGLPGLPVQSDVQAKAQAWAEQLAHDGYLHHSNLTDGISTPWCSLGENIGYGPTIASIENAYMHSPTHRENILASKWNGAGAGVFRIGSRVYTVQEFIRTC